MRAPNYYAHPGFERAGLRRREAEWIRDRLLHRDSLFGPVWRSHNLVVEIEGGDPRAAVLGFEAIGSLLGVLAEGDVDERLVRGEFVFLGVVDERPHFALDLSAHEEPL